MKRLHWIIFAFAILFLLSQVAMICRAWDFSKGGWKTVMCIQRPHVRQGKLATSTSAPTDIPTEIVEETPTPTSWVYPYPPIETPYTPAPYP